MEAFAAVKQPRFLIGESIESSDANIELHYVLKINEEHCRFNRAITAVADAALDSDSCLGLSSYSGDNSIISNWVFTASAAVIVAKVLFTASALECRIVAKAYNLQHVRR